MSCHRRSHFVLISYALRVAGPTEDLIAVPGDSRAQSPITTFACIAYTASLNIYITPDDSDTRKSAAFVQKPLFGKNSIPSVFEDEMFGHAGNVSCPLEVHFVPSE